MSGGNFSVVTQIKRVIGKLPNGGTSEAVSEEAEGLVTLPGSGTDLEIRDIPVVTEQEEGMPCGYLASTCSSPDTGCSPSTVTRDQMRGADKARVAAIMEENVHLREMLVSQLDLIQQQSETILSKDKQLRHLREENGLLVQRLSRMERRCRGDDGSSGSGTERKSSASTSGKKRGRDLDNSAVSTESPVKKKKVEDASSLIEQQTSSVRGVVDSFGPRDDELMDEIMGDIVSVSRPDTPASAASVDTVQSDTSGQQNKKYKKNSVADGKRKSLGGKCNNDGPIDREGKVKKLKSQASVSAPDTIPAQETKSLYYVGCRNDVLPNVDDHLDEVAALQRGVEVPCFREDKNHYTQLVSKLCFKKDRERREDKTWRIKSTNPIYSGGGGGQTAEDISDQALLKRHEKLEKDEKQRKRWDLQRLREETQLQKLRARHEKHILAGYGNLGKKEDSSLLPFIESAKYIQVAEDIPVSAFGRPMPDLPQATFTLPWVKSSRHSL